MSSRGFNLAGNRQLVLVGLGLLALVAVVAVLLVAVSPFGARVAHGSGTGGGCVATMGPACHFSRDEAFADFGSVSSDGCVFTDATIQPFQSLTSPGHISTATVFVAVNKFDNCQGIALESASNADSNTGLPDFTGTIHLDNGLSATSVVGTAPMLDDSFGSSGAQLFTATINVSWQGYGSTSRTIDSSHFHGSGLIVSTHFTGASRQAEASGPLTDVVGANLAIPATLDAQIDSATDGTVLITNS